MVNLYKASAVPARPTAHSGVSEVSFSAPDNYRHILAVTFTNKATEEMKARILHTSTD